MAAKKRIVPQLKSSIHPLFNQMKIALQLSEKQRAKKKIVNRNYREKCVAHPFSFNCWKKLSF